MTNLEQAATKMVCAGFHGTSIPAELDDLIGRGVGGIVFFSRNVASPQAFADLAADLKDRAKGRPLLTCIDQEGGRVMRLREPFTIIPPMRAVGAAGDEKLAREIGRVLGRELRAVNIDMDLAPVLDVDTNPDNPVIGARSFGRDADLVARMGCALLQGLQAEGVAACGKHFPGHGDTSQDSHYDLPRLNHSLERLLTVELRPFKEALRAGIAAIMSAHVVFTPIDDKYPATLSEPVLNGLLRKRLMHDGVIISDAMDMKAIADHFGFDEAIVRGARAGIDLFMLCHSHEQQYRAIEVLVKAMESGELSRERVAEAGERLDRLFAKFVKPPTRGPLPSSIGSPEHQAVVQRVIELSDPASLAVTNDPTEAR
jgi:beta-N-acetylhexosaminidase